MASSSSSSMSLLLLLLLVATLVSAGGGGRPRPKPKKKGGFYSPATRKAGKDQVKDYLEQQGQQKVDDMYNSSRGGGQLGGAAADNAPALVFTLSMGTPDAQKLSVIMDINSDIVWSLCACNEPGASCLGATGTPFYQPPAGAGRSSFYAVDCASPACQETVTQTCAADNDTCTFAVHYNDDASSTKTSGILATETFTFGTTTAPVDDLLFGCSFMSTVDLGGASGSVGFNRGNLSIVSQLQLSSFSYLISSDDPSSFVAWSWDKDVPAVNPSSNSRSTPLLPPESTPEPSLYYVKLTGVEVDGKLLKIKPGTFDVRADGTGGGMILSTTQPVTYLDKDGYDALRTELVKTIAAQGVKPVKPQDLEHLCYMTTDLDEKTVPAVTLVFDGRDARMELDVKNYFFNLPADSGGAAAQTCLTILPSSGGSVLGSLLQMDMNITFDIDRGMLMFDKATAATPASEAVMEPAKTPAKAAAAAMSLTVTAAMPLVLLFVCHLIFFF